ncbi:hypothetical protein [Microbacterium xylanilyticum]
MSSWLGGELLAGQVPIVAGRVTAKATQDVPEKLTLTVPRFAAAVDGGDVVDWRPGTNTRAALARFGQQLDVTVIVSSVANASSWETRIGRYQISDWADDDSGAITVTAEGLLARPRDDKLTQVTSPTGTLTQEVRRLIPPGMGVSFDSALVDRTCPTSMSWSEDRLGALQEIARAWPALLRTDEWGQIRFKAPLPAVPTPVVTLTDGEGGTLISAPRADSRKDAYNVVVATSSASDRADVFGVAQVTAGPMSVNGPYGRVVKRWSSPLLDSAATAAAAAKTMLDNSTRPAQSVPVTIAPDPRIDLDDPVKILRGTDWQLWGWVTGYDLPLTATGGAMRIDVGVAG